MSEPPRISDPIHELAIRAEEMTPHQRATGVVLRMWGRVSVPASLVVSLVLGTWLAWTSPGTVNPLILAATYFLVGMPTCIALFLGQDRMRKAIAKRVLRQLDAPVRGALSGGESSAAFQTTRDDDARGK